jgi:hypothetical protein
VEAGPGELLDQSLDALGQGAVQGLTVGGGQDVAEVFHVGIAGVLSHVDLQVGGSRSTSGNLIFEIRNVDAFGLPVSDNVPVIASKVFSPSTVPNFVSMKPGQFVSVDLLSAGIHVRAGDALALVLRSPAADPDTYGWFQVFSSFPGRDALYRKNGVWVDLHSATNLGFRTFVTVVPEPASQLLAGVALLCVSALSLSSAGRRREMRPLLKFSRHRRVEISS